MVLWVPNLRPLVENIKQTGYIYVKSNNNSLKVCVVNTTRLIYNIVSSKILQHKNFNENKYTPL